MTSRGRTSSPSLLFIGCGAIYGAFSIFMIVFGAQHVDEGYYHLIAHLTARGKHPYFDYFYVQMPVFPFVYGMLFRAIGSGFAVARGISACFSLAAFLVAGSAARRLAGPSGAIAAFLLILSQPFTIYYLTIVKLYALSAFLVSLALYCLVRFRDHPARYIVAAIFLSLGACTRISIAPGVAVLVILAFARTRKPGIAAASAAAALGVGAVWTLPFILKSREIFFYDVIGYHLEKESFGGLRRIVHRLDNLFHLSELYFVILVVVFVLLASRLILRRRDGGILPEPPDCIRDGYWIVGAITAFHFTSQAPYVYRYLPMLVPAAAMMLGAELVTLKRILEKNLPSINWTALFVMACAFTLAARGHADLSFENGGALLALKRVATSVQLLSKPGAPILTFNNSVAVEAGRDVVSGDEMNVLTYDPAWTDERCRKFKILNKHRLVQIINDKIFGAILLTRYSFIGNFPVFYNPGETGARPAVMAAIENNYVKVRTFKKLGYLGEDAFLYIPHPSRRKN